MRLSLAAILLAAVCLPAGVTAQSAKQYTVNHWTTEQGLPNNSVAAVIQTREGDLWLGTWAGAARFDGIRFAVVADDLPNDHARVLLEDRDGSFWISLAGEGLVQWRDHVIASFTTANGLAGLDVRTLAQDAAGRIWAGTESGVSVIAGGKASTISVPDSIRGVPITTVARLTDGSILVSSATHICQSTEMALTCDQPATEGRIGAVLRDRRGRLWIGTDVGLFVDGVRRVDASISTLTEARDGTVWAGLATGGVAHVDATSHERYTSADGFPPVGPVTMITEDREGSIWVATPNGGLTRLVRTRVTWYSTADGLSAPVVGSIVRDRDGNLFVGTACGPVNEWRNGHFVPRFENETAGSCPKALWAARDGSLWIGSRGGLFRWDGSRLHHFTTRNGLSHNEITGLFEDREGRMWIGTELGGLHVFEHDTLSRAYGPSDGVVTHRLSSFAQDREGRVWIGSNSNGLSVFENGKFRILSADEAPPTRSIAGLLVDSRGDLWIGSAADGLFRRRNGRYEQFGPDQGLGDRLVALALEDHDGNIWVATARGISRLERARIEDVANGRSKSLDPILLTRSDGLRQIEGSGGGFDPSGLRDRDGKLWFSTIGGIAVIDPAAFTINRVAPQVVVNEVRLDDAIDSSRRSVLSVPPGTISIELSYSAFSFIDPSRVRFRYRMVGLENTWHEAGPRRTAYYSRLEPGDYHFEVMAANNDGVWSDRPATLALTVLPYWWERTSVRAAGVVALVVLTAVLISMIDRQRARRRMASLEREQALNRERSRIARDLHDDLGSRLAQIALMGDDPSGSSSREEIGSVAREALQTMDELVWAVNARNDTVESFAAYVAEFIDQHMQLAQLRCRFQATPNLSGTLSADTRRHLYLAFKEAAQNIVKHAQATEVRVHLTMAGGRLSLEINDNGVGIDSPDQAGLGNGLRNMRERMDAIGGNLTIGPTPGGGTAIVLTTTIDS
jgi:ligand-binding sensor domain-containing protein/signal transduction histidine kinase